MKLAKYLADYIEHEQEKYPRESGLLDLEYTIQQGIEAFCSTEDSIVIVSKLSISTGHTNEVERYSY